MSKYFAPKKRKTNLFNLSDYQYQDNFVSFNEVLNINNQQVITGEKTFSTDLIVDSTATTGSLTITDNKIKQRKRIIMTTTFPKIAVGWSKFVLVGVGAEFSEQPFRQAVI